MKCKKCKRVIPENSIFCNWCGYRQIAEQGKDKQLVATKRSASSWRCQFMIDGERHSVTRATEKECLAAAEELRQSIFDRGSPDKRVVGDAVDAYIDSLLDASPSTIAGYKSKRNHNFQSLMKLPVSALTLDTVQKAVNAEAKKYSGKTVKNAWALISAATDVHYDKLRLPSPAPKKKPPVYSSDELRRLLSALAEIGGETEAAALLAMWLSLRRSEIIALRRCDILADAVRVAGARVYDADHKLVYKETKTAKSERVIPCNAFLLDKLNALPGNADNEFLFQSTTSQLHTGLKNACAAADVPASYLHGLRHTNASLMALLGIDTKYAMKRGGWSTESTMRNVYQDTMSEGERAAAYVIDDYFLSLIAQNKT